MDSPPKDHLESICVRIGSPSLYNAVPNRKANKYSSFQAFDFGNQFSNAEHKTVLLVGRTATGKSTLINSLFNYIFGIEWSDKLRYDFIQDEPVTFNRSKTQRITAYTLHHNNAYRTPYTWTIIDTPGFDNTHLTDENIAEQLQEFLSEAPNAGINHIHAVGFTVPASLKWFNGVEQFICKTLKELLWQDSQSNLCFLITFADLETPAVKAIKLSGIREPKYISFNNSALFSQRKAKEPQDIPETKTKREMRKLFWEKGYDGCKELLDFADKLMEITLKKTHFKCPDAETYPLDQDEQSMDCILEKSEAKTSREKKEKESKNVIQQAELESFLQDQTEKEAAKIRERDEEISPQDTTEKNAEYFTEQAETATSSQHQTEKQARYTTEWSDADTCPDKKEDAKITEQTDAEVSLQDQYNREEGNMAEQSEMEIFPEDLTEKEVVHIREGADAATFSQDQTDEQAAHITEPSNTETIQQDMTEKEVGIITEQTDVETSSRDQIEKEERRLTEFVGAEASAQEQTEKTVGNIAEQSDAGTYLQNQAEKAAVNASEQVNTENSSHGQTETKAVHIRKPTNREISSQDQTEIEAENITDHVVTKKEGRLSELSRTIMCQLFYITQLFNSTIRSIRHIWSNVLSLLVIFYIILLEICQNWFHQDTSKQKDLVTVTEAKSVDGSQVGSLISLCKGRSFL